MNVSGKNILIIGLARSGLAAADLLLRRGARVTGADRKSAAELGDPVRDLAARGFVLRDSDPGPAVLDGIDLVVLSPGVPRTAPLPAEALRRGIPLIGELELAGRFAAAPIVALTGTNGKSTTVTWIGALAEALGVRAFVAGNVGTAFASVVEQAGPGDLLVLEVSSFQLETTEQFRPKVAVVLNLAPDHLDRYASVDDYYETKARIFAAQGQGDVTVLNAADPAIMAWAGRVPGRIVTFGGEPRGRHDTVTVENGTVVLSAGGTVTPLLPAARIGLPGPHNRMNALAALAALHGAGLPVTRPEAAECLVRFRGLPHRIEFVGSLNGVRFYNDSKATNTDSLSVALRSFPEPIVLIAGGRDKKGDFASLTASVRERVACVVTIGEAAETISRAWGDAVPDWVHAGRSLERAVEAAYQEAFARQGVVLLSPGCASFDMFRDYEDRGHRFRDLVQGLGAERAAS